MFLYKLIHQINKFMDKFQDNSKYFNMINNKPSLSLIPQANKRLLAQGLGIRVAILSGIGSFASIVLYKYFIDNSSLYLTKTKKEFSFESDLYSGKVKCNYKDIPNRQHGY